MFRKKAPEPESLPMPGEDASWNPLEYYFPAARLLNGKIVGAVCPRCRAAVEPDWGFSAAGVLLVRKKACPTCGAM